MVPLHQRQEEYIVIREEFKSYWARSSNRIWVTTPSRRGSTYSTRKFCSDNRSHLIATRGKADPDLCANTPLPGHVASCLSLQKTHQAPSDRRRRRSAHRAISP